MSIGMSREEFWNGDPMLIYDYIEADKLRRKRINETAWLNGMYIHEAVSVAIVRAFSKDRSNLPSYTSVPYDIFGENKQNEEEQAEFAEAWMNSFERWADSKER